MSKSKTNPAEFNREAWNRIAEGADKWFGAVSMDEIEQARGGNWNIKLTPTQNVPKDWFGDVADKAILCLAAGGGQQAPLLAAAGAHVTVVDNSEKQLARDTRIAVENQLDIKTIVADMRDLRCLANNGFDLIVNPTSICYVEEIQSVWNECSRVLKPGGSLLAGFMNPIHFVFDPLLRDRGELVVKHRIPYSDLDLAPEVQERFLSPLRPIEFGHSLESMIGGQVKAGLAISGFFTDRWGDSDALGKLIDVFVATKSTKL